jgi:hypothetical protein
MNPRVVSCIKCEAPLASPEFYHSGTLTPCPACGARLRVELFPAFFREEARGVSGENVVVEGEASCFYHPQKRAVISCEACGRFVCALCEIELNGRHLCPVCLERGQQKGTLTQLENQRVRYDLLALLIAVGPLLLWPFTAVTGPGAVIFALWHWNSPQSIVRPTRVFLVLAVIVGCLEMIGWAIGLWHAFRS